MRERNQGNGTKKPLGTPISWNGIAVLAFLLLLSWLAVGGNYRFQITFESNTTSAQAAAR